MIVARELEALSEQAMTLMMERIAALHNQVITFREVLRYYAEKARWAPLKVVSPEDPDELEYSDAFVVFLPTAGELDGYVAAHYALMKFEQQDADLERVRKVVKDFRAKKARLEALKGTDGEA